MTVRRTISTLVVLVGVVVIFGAVYFLIQMDSEEFETTVGDESVVYSGHGMTFEIFYDDISSISLDKGYYIDYDCGTDFCNSRITIAHNHAGDIFLVYVDPMYTIGVDLDSGEHYTINLKTDGETLELFDYLKVVASGGMSL